MIEIFIIIFLLLQLIESKHFNISGKLTKGMLFATDYSYFYTLNEKEIPLNCPDFFIRYNDSILFYILKPNYTIVSDGCSVKLSYFNISINSDNFRDREYTIEKLNDTIRVIALGDSFTFGWGVELNDTWPKQLENLLNKKCEKKKFEVLNMGVPGYNTPMEIEFFKLKGIKYNPDIVILAYVGNDLVNETLRPILLSKLREEYSSKLVNKTDRLSQKEFDLEIHLTVEKKLAELAYYNNSGFNMVAKALEELNLLSKEKNISIIILSFADPTQTEFLKNISSNFGWKFLWIIPYLNSYPVEKMILHPVDPHPTPFAYNIVAENLGQLIINDFCD
jgi:lysophospholipase L1-like esterase